MTYGYLTKNTRIRHNLPKEHHIDARCISGNPDAVSDGTYYYQKKVRCHNRQIHKQTILKGSIRKSNQAEYLVKGYRLFDKVQIPRQGVLHFRKTKNRIFWYPDIIWRKSKERQYQCKETYFCWYKEELSNWKEDRLKTVANSSPA